MADHPSLPPELRGAINLDDPIQNIITQFKQMCIKERVQGVVLIGLTEDNNVALTFHVPQGGIQAMGLLAAALGMLTGRQGAK